MSSEIELLVNIIIFAGALWYSIKFFRKGVSDVTKGIKVKNKVIVVKGVGKIVLIPLVIGAVWLLGQLFVKTCYFCH